MGAVKKLMDDLHDLMDHAVGNFGTECQYSITFGASTPTITVRKDKNLVAEVWMANDTVHESKFHIPR